MLAFLLIPFRLAFGSFPLRFLLRVRLLLHFDEGRGLRRDGQLAVEPDLNGHAEPLLHQRAQEGVAARIPQDIRAAVREGDGEHILLQACRRIIKKPFAAAFSRRSARTICGKYASENASFGKYGSIVTA